LVVSVNTVRYHVKGIYGKLNVDKQSKAVERARALGLIQ
jgi:LuxR family maltose regulon positive regulatory protein